MNILFWKYLPEGYQGPPMPVEVNILTIIIPALILVGIVVYGIVKFRKNKVVL